MGCFTRWVVGGCSTGGTEIKRGWSGLFTLEEDEEESVSSAIVGASIGVYINYITSQLLGTVWLAEKDF